MERTPVESVTYADAVRWFESLDRHALTEAGGKGANLGELTRAGLPVPPGFVVTAAAYRAVLAVAGLPVRIAARLEGLAVQDLAALQVASREISAWIAAAAVPASIQAAITHAYAALCERMATEADDLPVAVRSSATAEDLPTASFAGQQETFLHVRGTAAVLAHVQRCWASLWTPQAIAYRAGMGFDHADVALAVVVQAMAPADVAGVMFTANPVSGRHDELLISAGYGLGESVVSGSITPDTFVLAPDGTLRARTLGTKAQRSVPDGNGTRTEPVPDAWQARFCLGDQDLAALAGLARRVAAHYGTPQDTEWALGGGTLYLLQARPITTLSAEPVVPSTPDEAPINRKPSGIKQLLEYWPEPPTPLDLAFFRAASAGTNTLLRLFGLRPARELPEPVEQPDGRMAVRMANPRLSPAILWSVPAQLLFTHGDPLARWQPVAEAMAQAVARWQAAEATADAPALARLVVRETHESGMLLGRRFAAVFFVGIKYLILTKLWAWLAAGRAGAALEDRLMRASPFRTALQNQAVAQLAQVAAADGKGSPQFAAALEDFLAAWGTRPARGMVGMVSTPTLREDPDQVLGLVDALLSDSDALAPEESTRREAAGYHAARAEAEQALWAPLRKRFRSDLEYARNGVITREDSLFRMEAMTAVMRHTALRLGKQLVAGGVLDAPDDVFFLLADELLPAAEGKLAVRERISRRRQGYRRVVAAHKRGQHWLVATGSIAASAIAAPQRTRAAQTADATTLTGLAASSGQVTGAVCVIRGPHEFSRMRKGAVLVAPFTAPVWTPLFRLASAVITEIGSPVSHAAIVAREYGIPAVVAVPNATSVLRDGQHVHVDGARGVIRITTPETNGGRS
ncbi:MAG: pyruvate, phosphate dikinase [Kouleothrix sp.]|jgi:pyruvate,water dikinase|nr:pyruvate, phosphate dikinase [Kouleothrix sp.]